MNCVCFERTSRIALYNKRRKAERERERKRQKRNIAAEKDVVVGRKPLPALHALLLDAMPCMDGAVMSRRGTTLR